MTFGSKVQVKYTVISKFDNDLPKLCKPLFIEIKAIKSLKYRQLKSNNSCISKDSLMNIHAHLPTSCSVKFHEILSIFYQVMVL